MSGLDCPCSTLLDISALSESVVRATNAGALAESALVEARVIELEGPCASVGEPHGGVGGADTWELGMVHWNIDIYAMGPTYIHHEEPTTVARKLAQTQARSR